MRGKVTPAGALKPHKIPREDLKAVQAIYEKVESRPQRYELNLYVTGYDEDDEPVPAGVGAGTDTGAASAIAIQESDGQHAPSAQAKGAQ